jgi:hypothetical protein
MNRKLEQHQQYCAPRTIFKEQKKGAPLVLAVETLFTD